MLEADVVHIKPAYFNRGSIPVTRIKHGKFMLSILGAMAEMERELTVERIRENMAKAKLYNTRSGRPVGRPPREIPASFKK